MKRLHHIVILTLTLLALNSCEYEFDVKSKAKPGIYAQCIVNSGNGTIQLKLDYASPAQGNTTEIPKLQNVTVNLRADGVTNFAFAGEIDHSIHGMHEGQLTFFNGKSMPAGSEIELSVKAEGLTSITSSCIAPADVQIDSIGHQIDSIMNMQIDIFNVFLAEQPVEGQYIAFKLEKRSWTDDKTFKNEIYTPMMGNATDTEIEIARISLIDNQLIDETDVYGDVVTVMPAAAIKNKQFNFTLLDFDAMWPDDPDDEEEKVEYVKIDYKISAFGVDENFYRYSLANYRSRSDFMAMMGLAPANFAWSNIKGGFGVCGAMSKIDEYVIE